MFGHIITGLPDVVVLIILFGLAIFIHELGHFIAARWCGFVIDVFSIGFGPSIWEKKINGVTYKIGAIPFGGYVALPQIDPSGMAIVQGEGDGGKPSGETTDEKAETVERNIPPVAPWKKIVVSVAGALGNVILAIVLAWLIYLDPHAVTAEGGPLLIGVVADSPAFQNGLRTGDEMVAVNGKKVTTWYDYQVECLLSDQTTKQVRVKVRSDSVVKEVMVPVVHNELGGAAVDGVGKLRPCLITGIVSGGGAEKAGLQTNDVVKAFDGVTIISPDQFTDLVYKHSEGETSIIVERNGKLIPLKVTPRYIEKYKVALIGVHLGLPGNDVPWMQYKNPMDQLKYDATSIKRLLKGLVTPREFKQVVGGLGGPVSIALALWMAIKISFLNGLGFLRFLCVNLAIINMLPIPVLDGGHVVFAMWEIVTRRKVHPKVANTLVNVFASLLIAAILYLTYKDIMRIPKIFRSDKDKEDRTSLLTNSVQYEAAVRDASSVTTNADGKK